MTPIRNQSDFRKGYEWLMILQQVLAENGFGKPEVARKEIDSIKRELRAYANRGTAVDVGMGFMVERRIVKDYGAFGGYIELVSIPDVFDVLHGDDGAEAFFKTFIEHKYNPSPYDCTGQTFTRWYKIFKRNNQYWVFHSVGIDV